jgi:hypothetical protein
MGDINKGVANTLQPAKKYTKNLGATKMATFHDPTPRLLMLGALNIRKRNKKLVLYYILFTDKFNIFFSTKETLKERIKNQAF